MVLTNVSIVQHKVGLRIDIPTKSRTYETLVLTSVSIFLQKVEHLIHWS